MRRLDDFELPGRKNGSPVRIISMLQPAGSFQASPLSAEAPRRASEMQRGDLFRIEYIHTYMLGKEGLVNCGFLAMDSDYCCTACSFSAVEKG